MNCQDVVRYLSDYIDGVLDEPLMEEARAHIATCRNCHVVLDSTKRTILLYRRRGERVGLSPRRHEALFAQLSAALAQRVDDCEPE